MLEIGTILHEMIEVVDSIWVVGVLQLLMSWLLIVKLLLKMHTCLSELFTIY